MLTVEWFLCHLKLLNQYKLYFRRYTVIQIEMMGLVQDHQLLRSCSELNLFYVDWESFRLCFSAQPVLLPVAETSLLLV